MTQEDKKLLLEDLCSRLPYGVKIHNPNPRFPNPDEYIQTLTDIHGTMQSNWITFGTDCEEINVNWNIGNKEEDVPKPYLRSMTLMTEAEKEEFNNFPSIRYYEAGKDDLPWVVGNYKQIDWLNEHRFNYRLPNNLFIEAPDGMYNIKN